MERLVGVESELSRFWRAVYHSVGECGGSWWLVKMSRKDSTVNLVRCSGGVRGEVTIVVNGADARAGVATDPGSLRAAVAELEESGMRRKEAIAAVAVHAGVPKRDVYQVVHIDD